MTGKPTAFGNHTLDELVAMSMNQKPEYEITGEITSPDEIEGVEETP